MKQVFTIAAGIVLAVLIIAFLPAITHMLAFAVGILWYSGLGLVLLVGGAIWFLLRGSKSITKGPWAGKRWF